MPSNYPTGVTGNEPQITGEYPCYTCGGSGGERDDPCWMCGCTGIHPEEAPECPSCGSDNTAFFGELEDSELDAFLVEHSRPASYDEWNVLVCRGCGEVQK